MGAYYNATLINEKEQQYKRFDTWAKRNGAKLMEHSYIGNDYVMSIEAMLLNNPQRLVWLCDYHEQDKRTLLTWDNTEGVEKYKSEKVKQKRFIINHTKNCYINITKLIKLYKKEGQKDFFIHPLPILCNSDTASMGGGDYCKEDSRRAIWCEDIIEVSYSIENFKNFEDVTEDCLFFEH